MLTQSLRPHGQLPLGCPTVTNSKTLHNSLSRAGLGLATLGAAALIAGCGGSSGSSSTITIGNENKSDEALAKVTAPATTSTPTPAPAKPTVKTPTSGPLSKEPKVTPPAGPAPTKLVVKDIVKGTGAVAKLGSSITVNYVGALAKGGAVFDASWKRGEPTTFPLEQGGLIAGWVKGIPGMKVGGRRELIIPAAEAYGAKGTSGIPPNSPLVFVIDLLGV
jgi:peptidylprolyl isomerase